MVRHEQVLLPAWFAPFRREYAGFLCESASCRVRWDKPWTGALGGNESTGGYVDTGSHCNHYRFNGLFEICTRKLYFLEVGLDS